MRARGSIRLPQDSGSAGEMPNTVLFVGDNLSVTSRHKRGS